MRHMSCLSFFALLLALLSGCAAPPTTATATTFPFPTDTPRPSQTPTSTLTEIPTATPHFSADSLTGLDPAKITAIKAQGVESSIRFENGHWTTTVITGFDEKNQPISSNINIDLSTINVYAANKNLYGITPTFTQDGATYLWSQEHSGWFKSFEIQYGNIKNPVTLLYGYQDVLLRSLFLDKDFNQPFPAGTHYSDLSIDFLYKADGSKFAYLRSRGLQDQGITWDQVPVQLKDTWYQIVIPKGTHLQDGTVLSQDITFLVNPGKFLDTDTAKPQMDEWKIIFFTFSLNDLLKGMPNAEYLLNIINAKDELTVFHTMFYPVLSANQEFDFSSDPLSPMTSQPSLVTLLNLKGNDPGKLAFWSSDLFNRMNELGPTNTTSETPLLTPGIPYQVPPEIQTMFLPAIVGNWGSLH